VAAAYDFAKSGAGEYSIEPSNFFTYVDGDGTPQDFYATIGNAAKVKLSGGLPEAAPRVHDKRASFNGCSANQQLLLNTAVANAQFYVRNSFLYISRVLSGTPRYTTWFGAYDSTRKNVVRSHFQLISGNNFSSFKYDCTCTKVDTFAYVCGYPQLLDCYLAIDKCLNQIPMISEPSTSAVLSGTLPPPVPIPRPGPLSTRLPTSPSTVVLRITFTVKLAVRVWPTAIHSGLPSTPTATSTSRRIAPLRPSCYSHDRKEGFL